MLVDRKYAEKAGIFVYVSYYLSTKIQPIKLQELESILFSTNQILWDDSDTQRFYVMNERFQELRINQPQTFRFWVFAWADQESSLGNPQVKLSESWTSQGYQKFSYQQISDLWKIFLSIQHLPHMLTQVFDKFA